MKNNKTKTVKAVKVKAVKLVGATYAQAESGMRDAELFNCRKLDCVYADGAIIKRGAIVQGRYGFCVAMRDVKGVKAERSSGFKANCIVSYGTAQIRARANLTDAKAGYVVCQDTGNVLGHGKGTLVNMQLTAGGESKAEREYLKVKLEKAL